MKIIRNYDKMSSDVLNKGQSGIGPVMFRTWPELSKIGPVMSGIGPRMSGIGPMMPGIGPVLSEIRPGTCVGPVLCVIRMAVTVTQEGRDICSTYKNYPYCFYVLFIGLTPSQYPWPILALNSWLACVD